MNVVCVVGLGCVVFYCNMSQLRFKDKNYKNPGIRGSYNYCYKECYTLRRNKKVQNVKHLIHFVK